MGRPAPDTGWLAHLSKAELADLIGYPGTDTAEQRRNQRALFGPPNQEERQ